MVGCLARSFDVCDAALNDQVFKDPENECYSLPIFYIIARTKRKRSESRERSQAINTPSPWGGHQLPDADQAIASDRVT